MPPPVISEKSSAPVLTFSLLDVRGTHLSKIKDALENAFCIRFDMAKVMHNDIQITIDRYYIMMIYFVKNDILLLHWDFLAQGDWLG